MKVNAPHKLTEVGPDASLQITFVYKQVICQAKAKFWPDNKL